MIMSPQAVNDYPNIVVRINNVEIENQEKFYLLGLVVYQDSPKTMDLAMNKCVALAMNMYSNHAQKLQNK